MLSLDGIYDLLNSASYKDGYRKDVKIMNWRRVYYGMSLHISGVCPAYQYLRYENGVYSYQWWYPNGEYCYEWEYQFIFDAQLFSRHPREPEITRQWRLSQYKPFTKAPFKRVIQVITGALFQDSGYSITVDDQADNDYIWGNNFHGRTLAQFIQDKFQSICEDPNGVFVVMPKEPYYATTTQQVEPDVWFVPSKMIRYCTKEEIIFERDDLHWAINTIGYFRFAKGEDKKYHNVDGDAGGYYTHMLGHVPAYVAGGQWNTKGYFDSWLDAAKAIADEFVASKSAEQLVNKDASHPYTIESDVKCPDCDNHSGHVQWCMGCNHRSCDCSCQGGHTPENAQLKICNTCLGNGSISRNPADRIIAPPEQMDKDLIKIVSPQVDINKFHAENNAMLYDAMLKELYLHRTDKAESGAAKAIDQEWKYQFFCAISNDLFGRLLTSLLKDILGLRNVTATNGAIQPAETDFTIVKPSQFQVKTSYDLQEEYKVAKESGLPAYQLSKLLADYSDKRFGGDDAFLKKDYYINQLDTLSTLTYADIQIVLLNNGATVRDFQFHIHLPKILDTIIREQTPDNFVKMSFEQVQQQVETMFAALRPELPTVEEPTEEPEEILENRVEE